MLHDPIQAFFRGITSTFARITFGLLGFILALVCYILAESDISILAIAGFPFVTLGMIFVWGSKGILFFIGIISIVSVLFLAWKLIDTADPKLVFILLFAASFIYFLPISWQEDYPAWKAYLYGGGFFAVYFSVGYLLPVCCHYLKTRKSA